MSTNTETLESFGTDAVLDQYIPYSCTELTSKQIKFARESLNETDGKISRSLRRIKTYIQNELNIFSEIDDTLLLCILRSRIFDLKKTCFVLRSMANFAKTYGDYFSRIDIEIVRRVIASKAVGFLPYRDAEGRALVLITAENWNPDDLKAEDILFGAFVAASSTVDNPVNQVAGYIVIVDCRGVYYRQYWEMMSWILFGVHNLLACCPIRIWEIHILHTPYLIQLMWNAAKPFLDESIQNRFIFYDSSNWESIHEKIPTCILPEEIGGQLGPFTNEHWATDIDTIRETFFERLNKFLN